MAGFVVKINGLDKTLQRFLPKKYEPQIQQAFDKFGTRVRTEAIRLAPVDESLLRQSIFFDKIRLGVEVGASVEYAAFIEFGTRKYAAAYVGSLPKEWKELAAMAKGKSGKGSFNEFIQRIMAWVRRKGINAIKTKSGNNSTSKDSLAQMQQAAYAIALNILQNGIKPQPFLYPAVNNNTKQLLNDLNKIKL